MDRKTVHAYDEQAKNYYDKTVDFWELFPVGFIEAFSARSGKRILDVGCGPGRDAILLRDLGHDLVCLDASESMVAICRSKGLESVRADFMELPFKDNEFDAVWAYTSLLHIEKSKLPKALAEIRRVMKPEGIVGLGMIEGDGEGYVESKKVTLPRYFAYYIRDELKEIVEENGFILVDKNFFQPKARVYINYLLRSDKC